MKVLLLGARGLLGSALQREMRGRGWDCVALGHQEFDVTRPDHIGRIMALEWGDLDAVINATAYTKVDDAESHADLAFSVNADAVGMLGVATSAVQVRLVHFSTDYVFDGSASTPMSEDQPVHPLGVYGESKRAGEERLLNEAHRWTILRTSWLYGPDGACFPRSVARRAWKGDALRVVADQVGTPTCTLDLATKTCDLLILGDQAQGLWHAAGPEAMNWHALAEQTLQTISEFEPGWQCQPVTPIRTLDWPTPAKRPAYSVLDSSRLAALVGPMRPVRESLRQTMEVAGSEFWQG